MKLSTESTPTNIARVTALLAATPPALIAFSQSAAPESLVQPFAPGERSFAQIAAHIVHCDDRTTEAIYAALLLPDPLVLELHPERQWGKLLDYARFAPADVLTYFRFRRHVLLTVLHDLTPVQWTRTLHETGKVRHESVYWRARAQALHEVEHLAEIETRFGTITAH